MHVLARNSSRQPQGTLTAVDRESRKHHRIPWNSSGATPACFRVLSVKRER